MKKNYVSIFVSVLLSFTIISDVQAIQMRNDELEENNLSPTDKFLGHKYLSSERTNDAIIDILQNVTEPLYLSYLENITAFGPRVTGTASCHNTGTYLYNTFQDLGLAVRYQEWNNGGYQDRNVEATLPGLNETSDELYLIFGHYDTVANCPGADDDASGVATVLVAASLLRQYSFNHTIRFVAFSGEEQWMLGSYKYVEEAVQNGDNIVAVLNVDMIGYALTQEDKSKIKIYDNGNPRWVTNFTVNISQTYQEYIQLTAVPSGFAYSDQYYFWEFGYEGIFYHEYKFNDFYHTSQDTIAHMNISYATRCSRLSIATLVALAEIQDTVNDPPEIPEKPSGPIEGDTHVEYTFSTKTVDPNADQVYYLWFWGDEMGEWIGPFSSGETIYVTHEWTSKGVYEITVKAKDSNNAVSNWSEPLIITINAKPMIEIGNITGGFGIHAQIRNTGDLEAANVTWRITLQGLIFIGKEKTGTFVKITPGSSSTASSGFIFGVGPARIIMNVTADNITPVEKQVSAFIFGPFVLRVK